MKRLALLLCLWLCAGGLWAEEPLTSIAAIRALTPAEAAQGLPVRLEAVVTFYNTKGNLFVADEHDGIYVAVGPQMAEKLTLQVGDKLWISGVTKAADFLIAISPQEIKVTTHGEAIHYHPIPAGDLFLPKQECQPVEVDAVVKGTFLSDHDRQPMLTLELSKEGWNFRGIFNQEESSNGLPLNLIEKHVRVRGVAASGFNDQRQLTVRLIWISNRESVTVLDELEMKGEVPLLAVDQLLRVDSPLRQRVRVRGLITHVAYGRGFYLRGEGGSMMIQTGRMISEQVGDTVEAEGYPVMTPFRPSLSLVELRKLEASRQEPAPMKFHPSASRTSADQAELVTLEAQVMEVLKGETNLRLLCRAEGHSFHAYLENPATPMEMPVPEMGVRLTGICELLSDHPQKLTRYASGFQLTVRTGGDIQILSRPPWLNKERTIMASGIACLLALAVGAWAITLNRQVKAQATLIRQHAMHEATHEERSRIARDLHDTLEQELMGVTLLLDDTAAKLNGAESKVGAQLGLARKLLRRAREESRSTIRDLRSVTLEMRGLHAALEEMTRPIASAAGLALHVSIKGEPQRLKGTLENHLLLMVREAVSNAARHAEATKVEVIVEYLGETLRVEVRDDGRGFDVAHTPPTGLHFGLRGLRERAEKIGGSLRIVSKPQTGTSVIITAPAVQPDSLKPFMV